MDEDRKCSPASDVLPDGCPLTADVVRDSREALAELGVSANGFQDWLAYLTRAAHAPPPPEVWYLVRTLQAEWGEEFLLKTAAAELATARLPVPVQMFLEETWLGNDLELARRMATIGAPIVAARLEIQRIREDPAHPYHHSEHPENAAAREAMRALHLTAYGQRAV
jgi:hypothetical protein